MSKRVTRPMMASAARTHPLRKLVSRLVFDVEGDVDQQDAGEEELEENIEAVDVVKVFEVGEFLGAF